MDRGDRCDQQRRNSHQGNQSQIAGGKVMERSKITKIETSISKPKITQITAQSYPDIWNLLLAPENREVKK